jgi:membrane protease YdiL (CAAX protease family)
VTSTAPPTWPAPELPERPEGAPPPAPRGPDAWPPWTAPIALAAGFIGANIGFIIVVAIVAAFGTEIDLDDIPPGVLLGGTFAQDVAFVAAAVLFARLSGPVFAEHFGLRPAPFWRSVGLIVALYVGFTIFAAIWDQIVDAPDDSELLDDLGVDENAALLIFGLFTVCVLAPLVEELFFRGFFYRALRNWAGVAGAAILTGLVFGAVHLASSPVEHLVPLAVLGALFCLLYQWTGSLYPCIAVHAINNAIAFSVTQDWTWQVTPVIVGSLATCLLIARFVASRWKPA